MPEYSIFHPKTGKTRSTRARDERHAIEICGWKAADCKVSIMAEFGVRKGIKSRPNMKKYLSENI